MAMGIPIICNSGVGDTEEIVKKMNAGKIIGEFNTAVYKQVVAGIDQIAALSPDKIIDGAYDIYSLEQGVEQYAKIYERLLHEK